MKKKPVKICKCGCPRNWHKDPSGSPFKWGKCTECNCKEYQFHHEESYGYRRTKAKLYVGIK